MRSRWPIALFVFRDVTRSKWAFIYGAFFLAVSEGLLRFGGDPAKAIVSLMNVTLFIVPLISLVFGAMYVYTAREFTELLLTQPMGRGEIYRGLFGGLTASLVTGYILGVGAPFVVRAGFGLGAPELTLLVVGALLTVIFLALAFLIAVRADDRGKGIGIIIAVWLFLAVVYDGLVLWAVMVFERYPLETPMIALTLLNPIDLGRILLLLQLDISALMGYTGAVFARFFGSGQGAALSFVALVAWALIPLLLGLRFFKRKDF